MADLIDRQAAIALFIQKEERFAENHLITPKFAEAIARVLQKLPAVDAVEVVRCGECTHRGKDSWCAYVDDDPNFYCKRGERREENAAD